MISNPKRTLTISAVLVVGCLLLAVLLLRSKPGLLEQIEECDDYFEQRAEFEELLEEGNLEKALKFADKIEMSGSSDDSDTAQGLRIEVANAYLKKDDLWKAEEIAEQISQLYDFYVHPEWEFLQGRILLKKGQPKEAIEAFEKASTKGMFCGNGMAEVRTKRGIGIAACYEELGQYKDAYLLNSSALYSTPGLYVSGDSAETVEDIRRLRGKLSDSEIREVDNTYIKKLTELMRRDFFSPEYVENMLEWLREESPMGENSPESVTYGFILGEAKRVGVVEILADAKRKMSEAREYEEHGKHQAAYLVYLDCLAIPWPYGDEGPIKRLRDLRDMPDYCKDCNKETMDEAARSKLAELLSNPETRESVESLAKLGLESITWWSIENRVYAFILEESQRLRLLRIDSESVNPAK